MKDRTPLYLQIQHYIKDQITSGKLQKDARIPSEKELVEQFQVSRITIANALAGLAKERWIYRIPGRGSFVQESRKDYSWTALPPLEQQSFAPDDRHGADAPQLKRTIGLIMPGIDDFFSIRLIKGIQEAMIDSDLMLAIILSNCSRDMESRAIREFLRQGADALIIFPVDEETYNEDILSLKMKGYPFMLIDRYLRGVETNAIFSDGVMGARLAVSHLWELGHRNISICSDTPLPNTTVENRIDGYMKELKHRGAMINPELFFTELWIDHKHIHDDHPLVRYMNKRQATAYISINANMGMLIHRVARKVGLRVPEDISIITFDDPSPGHEDSGFYTHIAQSENEMAGTAVRILADMLSGKYDPTQGYQKIVLQPRLVVRESTGAPA